MFGAAQGPHLRVLSATEGAEGMSGWLVDAVGFVYSHMCSLWPEATASTSPLSVKAREAMGRPASTAHTIDTMCMWWAAALDLISLIQPVKCIKSWKISSGQATSMLQSALRRTKVMVVDALPGADIPQPDLIVK